jgi:hypothetical protein
MDFPNGILFEGEGESKPLRPALAFMGTVLLKGHGPGLAARMWKSPPMKRWGLLITPQGRYGWGETGITA